MTVKTFSVLFSLLSLIALAGAVLTFILRFALRGPQWDEWREALGRIALPLAWLVAVVTTGGSLYYSEVQHFEPCLLCWYQRIAMYPLALLLGIATFRRDLSVRLYVIAQCAVGAVVATYHSYIQWFPPKEGTAFCTTDRPCTAKFVNEFGFVTLPFMALTAFLVIIALMLVAGRGTTADAGAADNSDLRSSVGASS